MLKITDQNKKKIGTLLLITGILVMLGLCLLIGRPLIRYAREPELFRAFMTRHGFWAYFLFVLAVVFQVIFAFIPGEPFELLAGYAFGTVPGTLLCLLGSALGSTIVFFLTRRFGVKFVELFFSMDKIRSMRFLNNKKEMYAITFLLFFIPGTPKDLLSYVAGLTPIRFLPYLLISTAAKIPSIVSSCMGGNAVGNKSYFYAAIVLTATALLSVTGIFIYRRIHARKSKEKETDFENKNTG
ncbi:MAG: TVP38/TMEM64 family protein [Clostridia bacterium]|nr:TVP38/TMEM64 family protein [Clostridia bacterium]